MNNVLQIQLHYKSCENKRPNCTFNKIKRGKSLVQSFKVNGHVDMLLNFLQTCANRRSFDI